jgi:dienelactone hydrolase
VSEFAAEMDRAGNAYRIVLYGGARHAFTVLGIGVGDGPLAYSPDAARDASAAMLGFLREHLAAERGG